MNMEVKKYWTKDEYGRWYLSDNKPLKTLNDIPYGFSRKCPVCKNEMMYHFKDAFEFDSKNAIPCSKCQQRKETPTRKCPSCGKVMYYINKYVYQRAVTLDGKCNSCSKKK